MRASSIFCVARKQSSAMHTILKVNGNVTDLRYFRFLPFTAISTPLRSGRVRNASLMAGVRQSLADLCINYAMSKTYCWGS